MLDEKPDAVPEQASGLFCIDLNLILMRLGNLLSFHNISHATMKTPMHTTERLGRRKDIWKRYSKHNQISGQV